MLATVTSSEADSSPVRHLYSTSRRSPSSLPAGALPRPRWTQPSGREKRKPSREFV